MVSRFGPRKTPPAETAKPKAAKKAAPKKKAAAKTVAPEPAADKITDKQKQFCIEYIKDLNPTNAAIRAGFSERSAQPYAHDLMKLPHVIEYIGRLHKGIEEKAQVSAARAVQEAWGVATADVNDLVEFRRRCCRHCFGIDYGYQRTMHEDSRARKEYNEKRTAAIFKKPEIALGYPDYDEQGGIGFDARRPPNPDCTNCWGDGVGDAFFKPTGNLTPAARALYAGVKQTKEGYQMLLVDKMAALEKVYKHLGLYKQDNEQKVDALGEFIAAVQAGSGKLPIKAQS